MSTTAKAAKPTKKVKIETKVSISARAKFKRKTEKNNTSMTEVLSDFVNKYNRS